MKSGPEIPKWAIGVAVVGVVALLLFVGSKLIAGDGPRDPSTYPKEAFSPPKYDFSKAGYTKDGKPVTPPSGR